MRVEALGKQVGESVEREGVRFKMEGKAKGRQVAESGWRQRVGRD